MLPAPQWKPDPDVIPPLIAKLLARPGRFDFFQALRLLAAWLAQQGVDADQVFEHGLHLHGSASLAFAPGQIEHCWVDDEGRVSCARGDDRFSWPARQLAAALHRHHRPP